MLNIVSRTLLFDDVTGPRKVVGNLIKGLEKLGYPYVLNKRLDYCRRLYIHDDKIALAKVSGLDPEIRVVVGPNLYVTPKELPQELDIARAVYLVPSSWTKSFWLNFGFDKCPMEVWPTGIDTEEFHSSEEKKEFILVYFKQRFGWELAKVETALKKSNLTYKVLNYSQGYEERDLKDLLKKTRYLIWLDRQESQGIALEEVLSSNVPILVCDVSSVGHCVGGGELNQAEKDFKNTTSAPYFDDRCGLKTKDLDKVGESIAMMEKRLSEFRPREYVLGNLGLEKQARALLDFYGKYFKISYESGLEEKPLRAGDWINAEWYYRFYLKFKHRLKMFLIKTGFWKLLGR